MMQNISWSWLYIQAKNAKFVKQDITASLVSRANVHLLIQKTILQILVVSISWLQSLFVSVVKAMLDWGVRSVLTVTMETQHNQGVVVNRVLAVETSTSG